MDLRAYRLDAEQIHHGSLYLRYQPFVLSDEVQTGVAWSWLHGQDGGRVGTSDDWVCQRQVDTPRRWAAFSDANARLRAMYDDWLDVIAGHFPGGSLADIGSNDGYFPVGAELRGMRKCVGYDNPGFKTAFRLLNGVVKTGARFVGKMYDSRRHELPGCPEQGYDVVTSSLVMCHLPDPLYFLAFLGRTARRGIFLYTGMADSDEYTIHYKAPNQFKPGVPFPHGFDNDTGLSRGLLYKSMEWMGFTEIVEIPRRDTWLRGGPFDRELKALLFLRPKQSCGAPPRARCRTARWYAKLMSWAQKRVSA